MADRLAVGARAPGRELAAWRPRLGVACDRLLDPAIAAAPARRDRAGARPLLAPQARQLGERAALGAALLRPPASRFDSAMRATQRRSR